MNKSPAFQFYPQDFLSSLDVQMMSAAEVGAYCLLLFNAWLSKNQGYLPNDDKILQFISRMTDEEWASSKKVILSKFQETNDRSFLFNERLISEKQKQNERSEKAKEAGRKSGVSRRKNSPLETPQIKKPCGSRDGTLNERSTDVQQTFSDRLTSVEIELNTSSSISSSTSHTQKTNPEIVRAVEIKPKNPIDPFSQPGLVCEFLKLYNFPGPVSESRIELLLKKAIQSGEVTKEKLFEKVNEYNQWIISEKRTFKHNPQTWLRDGFYKKQFKSIPSGTAKVPSVRGHELYKAPDWMAAKLDEEELQRQKEARLAARQKVFKLSQGSSNHEVAMELAG